MIVFSELVSGIPSDMMNVGFSDRLVSCRTPDNIGATESPDSPTNGEHLGKDMPSGSPSFSTTSLGAYSMIPMTSTGLNVSDQYMAHQQFSLAAASYPMGMSHGSIACEGTSSFSSHLQAPFTSTSSTSNLLMSMDGKSWPASFGGKFITKKGT